MEQAAIFYTTAYVRTDRTSLAISGVSLAREVSTKERFQVHLLSTEHLT